MSGKLPVILANQGLSERRGIKVVISGKSGIGKISQIAELIKSLPPSAFLTLGPDDDTPEPEVRS
jgi:ABC-type transport system involved in cytochrome bd biosynthesis fused ATPase/permease subunit